MFVPQRTQLPSYRHDTTLLDGCQLPIIRIHADNGLRLFARSANNPIRFVAPVQSASMRIVRGQLCAGGHCAAVQRGGTAGRLPVVEIFTLSSPYVFPILEV